MKNYCNDQSLRATWYPRYKELLKKTRRKVLRSHLRAWFVVEKRDSIYLARARSKYCLFQRSVVVLTRIRSAVLFLNIFFLFNFRYFFIQTKKENCAKFNKSSDWHPVFVIVVKFGKFSKNKTSSPRTSDQCKWNALNKKDVCMWIPEKRYIKTNPLSGQFGFL